MRHSGIELLRLVIMFGIVMSHWGGHGSFSLLDNYELGANYVWLQLAQIFGGVGTTTFVLISGYFSYKKENINWTGIRRVTTEVRFYSLAMWLVTLLLGFVSFNYSSLIGAVFPILVLPQYWFVLPYLLICLCSPLFNKIVSSAPRNQLIALLFVLVLSSFIYPALGRSSLESQLVRFSAYYVIGACLNKYKEELDFLVRYRYFILIASFLIIVSICTLTDVLGCPDKYGQFAGTRSPFTIILVIGLFMVFYNLDYKSNFINTISKSSFAIYLISENPNIYTWFWKRYFECMDFYDSPLMIPVSIFQCLIVCIGCILIDVICKRIRSLIKYDKVVELVENKIIAKVLKNKIEN